MKTFIAGLAVTSLLVLGAMAYAHGPGGGGWGGGHMRGNMMGQGYGGHMMGSMMGWGGQGAGPDTKFLDEIADLRKDLHEKRFEYFEASRNSGNDSETLAGLEKEIYDIQSKIRDKAPRTAYGGQGGYGSCW